MLKNREIIPALTARTPAGRVVQAWDYKQKRSLVVVFLHANCPRCEEYLGRVVARAPEFAERDAVALAIFAETLPPGFAEGLPREIVVATDVSGRSQRAFLGEEAFAAGGVGVFVADRYGELFAQWAGAHDAALPAVGEALSWLGQIQMACEECGAPDKSAE